MRSFLFLTITIFSAFFFSCETTNNSIDQERELKYQKRIEFAKGFTIEGYENYKKLEVRTPYQGAESGFSYYLVQKGDEVPEEILGERIISIPLSNIVCTSTTHIPLLEYIGEGSALKGFPNVDYISSSTMRDRINQGLVTDLGSEMSLNFELLLSIHPEIVMGYLMTGDLGQLGKIEKMDIPIVINAEYLEEHPLGRAEWIKFMGAFFNKEKEADSVFSFIKQNYFSTMERISSAPGKPHVLSGVVYGDTWFMPGGNNYASRLIADAAGKYLWGEDSSSGFLELSFESVYEHAVDAEYWIGVASYSSLNALEEGDGRYANFQAFQKGNIYSYNKRIGEKGGNEYLELGYLRPDIILNDLVAILHPEYAADHELYFFMKLE